MTTHILFDFFGTLVDYSASRTAQGYERSHRLLRSAGARLDYAGFLDLWSDAWAEFDRGAERSDREFSMVEVVADFLKRALGSRPPADLVARFVETYIAEWNKSVRYPSGLREFLERLSLRYGLGIITNTHHASLVRDHLDQIGVSNLFRAVVTSVEHGWRKPHPEIFLHTLRSLGAQADQSVYVGDSYEADYLGSRAVGMTPLLIDPNRHSTIPESSRLDALFQLEQRLQDAD